MKGYGFMGVSPGAHPPSTKTPLCPMAAARPNRQGWLWLGFVLWFQVVSIACSEKLIRTNHELSSMWLVCYWNNGRNQIGLHVFPECSAEGFPF